MIALLAAAALAFQGPTFPAKPGEASKPGDASKPERDAQEEADEEFQPARATRRDLARALVDFERALRVFEAREMPEDERNRVRERTARVFDRATFAFFLGDGAGALTSIRGLERELVELDPAARIAGALGARLEPEVAVAGSRNPLTVVLAPFFDPGGEAAAGAAVLPAIELALVSRARPGEAERPAVASVKLAPNALRGATRVTLTPETPLPEGILDVRFGRTTIATLAVLPRPARELREQFLARLDALPAAAELADARFSARARAALLKDAADPARSAEFLADLPALARDLATEIAELEAGRDPYRRRAGELWRALPRALGSRGKNAALPLAVFAPRATCGDEPHPLVIALHGAGGDELMFLRSYDLGRLAELAESRGFVLASPGGTFLGQDGARDIRALIERCCADYSIDRSRVYVLGHSMGAGGAASLAESLADRLAGVACLAGGSFPRTSSATPILALAGDADGVIGADITERAAAKARESGARIELRRLPHLGHLTMVGPSLPIAVDWLLARRR